MLWIAGLQVGWDDGSSPVPDGLEPYGSSPVPGGLGPWFQPCSSRAIRGKLPWLGVGWTTAGIGLELGWNFHYDSIPAPVGIGWLDSGWNIVPGL
jgi:hypothetical protein